ncbi:MAG: hypothetical protein ACM3S1_03585, partial [Hyphomicrobiales bacterium]
RITLYVVPVFEGRLVAFDVSAREARGRWLPFTVLDFAQNPYEAASMICDAWCQGQVSDLSLADVMSFVVERGAWELAIVFRAELMAAPKAQPNREPFIFAPGQFDAIGAFDPVDLERWVTGSVQRPGLAPERPAADSEPGMIF